MGILTKSIACLWRGLNLKRALIERSVFCCFWMKCISVKTLCSTGIPEQWLGLQTWSKSTNIYFALREACAAKTSQQIHSQRRPCSFSWSEDCLTAYSSLMRNSPVLIYQVNCWFIGWIAVRPVLGGCNETRELWTKGNSNLKWYTYKQLLFIMQVLGVTLDGNAVNRRFLKLHQPSSDLVYKVKNSYTEENRSLFFFNPPHLIKTVRNCWQSRHHTLWVCY